MYIAYISSSVYKKTRLSARAVIVVRKKLRSLAKLFSKRRLLLLPPRVGVGGVGPMLFNTTFLLEGCRNNYRAEVRSLLPPSFLSPSLHASPLFLLLLLIQSCSAITQSEIRREET